MFSLMSSILELSAVLAVLLHQMLARLQPFLPKKNKILWKFRRPTFQGENMKYENMNWKDLFCGRTKQFKSWKVFLQPSYCLFSVYHHITIIFSILLFCISVYSRIVTKLSNPIAFISTVQLSSIDYIDLIRWPCQLMKYKC